MVDETTLAKMRLGICPVCDKKMRKHSNHKLVVCKKLFKQRFGIKPAVMTTYDDKGNIIRQTNVDDAISLQKSAVESHK